MRKCPPTPLWDLIPPEPAFPPFTEGLPAKEVSRLNRRLRRATIACRPGRASPVAVQSRRSAPQSPGPNRVCLVKPELKAEKLGQKNWEKRTRPRCGSLGEP